LYIAQDTAVKHAKAQCHCRECQYITGGSPNVVILMPAEGFKYVKGQPKSFTRADIQNPATRYFCSECGTHIASVRAGPIVLKVGTLDDPKLFGMPQVAVQTADMQSFHRIPERIPTFERFPPRLTEQLHLRSKVAGLTMGSRVRRGRHLRKGSRSIGARSTSH